MNHSPQPPDIHRALLDSLAQGLPRALALILDAQGSTPQKAGVKALIDAEGRIFGTLGGGVVEGQVQALAADSLRSGLPAIHDFNLADPAARAGYVKEAGPICGGTMRILIDPALESWREAYSQALAALARRERGVLLTRIAPSPPRPEVQWMAASAVPAVTAAAAALADATPRLTLENPADPATSRFLFIEPVIPPPRLLVVGGGHVGQALARLADWNGFEVIVADTRPEFTAPALFVPGVQTRLIADPQALAGFPVDADTYIVIVTPGHRHDAEALEVFINTRPAYLGMIGSRRKVAMLRRHFLETGLATEDAWSRVFAPVGLDLGAQTVPEIATSIMAQIIAVRRQGTDRARRAADWGAR